MGEVSDKGNKDIVVRSELQLEPLAVAVHDLEIKSEITDFS